MYVVLVPAAAGFLVLVPTAVACMDIYNKINILAVASTLTWVQRAEGEAWGPGQG